MFTPQPFQEDTRQNNVWGPPSNGVPLVYPSPYVGQQAYPAPYRCIHGLPTTIPPTLSYLPQGIGVHGYPTTQHSVPFPEQPWPYGSGPPVGSGAYPPWMTSTAPPPNPLPPADWAPLSTTPEYPSTAYQPQQGESNPNREWESQRRETHTTKRRQKKKWKKTRYIDEEYDYPAPPTTPPRVTPRSTPNSPYVSLPPDTSGLFGLPGLPYYPWFTHVDDLGPRNLARRPRQWRPDYYPRGALSRISCMKNKGRSDVQEYTDSKRRTLHPLLHWTSADPPIFHDIRLDPFNQPVKIPIFSGLGTRLHNDIDMAQLATTPACSMMRIFHPSLPWFIDVKSTQENGVTISDVLFQISRQLMTPIHGRDYWNDELSDKDRSGLSKAWRVRCKGDINIARGGVCRIDFLGKDLLLEGLVRGKNGNWEMKMRRIEIEIE